jgi:type IV pilus assembly protein PilC
MAQWKYQGIHTQGHQVEGEFRASSEEELRDLLRQEHIILTRAEMSHLAQEYARSSFFTSVQTQLLSRVPLKSLARFTRQFSAMAGSGLPLMQCLETLSMQLEPLPLKKALLDIQQRVQGGSSLSEAFEKHPRIFSELYCGMLRAGELGGVLSPILNRLASYQEKNEALLRKVKKALLYPLLVLGFSVIVIGVLMTWVVPIFAEMFEQNGATLPLPTQIVIALSEWIGRLAPWILIVVTLLLYGVYRFYKSTSGRLTMDKWVLKFPLLGNLIKRSSVARFSRTLSTLLDAGVSLVDALEISKKVSGNKALEEGVNHAIQDIKAGQPLAGPLEKTGIFPPMSLQMIYIGEKTGELSQMLSKVADFYEDEVDSLVEGIMSLLEPFIIIFLGFFIGAILLAMYLPLFNIASQIG